MYSWVYINYTSVKLFKNKEKRNGGRQIGCGHKQEVRVRDDSKVSASFTRLKIQRNI